MIIIKVTPKVVVLSKIIIQFRFIIDQIVGLGILRIFLISDNFEVN
jgi:hypothetical protein